jgi:hypothetical protein
VLVRAGFAAFGMIVLIFDTITSLIPNTSAAAWRADSAPGLGLPHEPPVRL